MEQIINEYQKALIEAEKSHHTISKYIRDIKKFFEFLGEKELNKLEVLSFKNILISSYEPSSVNSILAAVNGFLKWWGYESLMVKPLKIQKEIFIAPEKELSIQEYQRLINTAEKKNNQRLSLMIQTICSTGIRVSELSYITTEAMHTRRAVVACKGKKRVIFLPKELCALLKKYCKIEQIKHGIIFRTKNGKPINRSNIWKMMKKLCKDANVQESKVFPHNLRHLFARTYYKLEKDISRLADILGHANINTTRIYTVESGTYHIRQINKMGLVLG